MKKCNNARKIKIAITLGDPAGIGPELILKGIPELKTNNNIQIFANKKILYRTASDLKLLSEYKKIKNCIMDSIPNIDYNYGKPTPKTGQIAIQSINEALKSKPDIIITPPVVKEVIRKDAPGFIGHTEYIARWYSTKDYAMVGIWREKRIMLLTTHMPLRRVFKKITPARIAKKISFWAQGLRKYFGIPSPQIGVAALNPHGFEFSCGEDEKIKQGIRIARKKKIDVHGPFPADSLFTREFNGFLAIYHDQAFVYLKSKKDGLNFTMGLPVIRLSPLYGAALDIAGNSQAEVSGFIAAVNKGKQIYKNVRNYEKKKKMV